MSQQKRRLFSIRLCIILAGVGVWGLSPARAQGQINGVKFSPSSYVAYFGDTSVTLTVVNSPVNPSQTVTVSWNTADGTAKAGIDYVGGSGNVVFAPGEGSKTIQITLLAQALPG